MSIKSGYGNLSDELVSLEVLGVLQDSNRNAILQLSGKQEKRITDIVAGYGLKAPTGGADPTQFEGGRLLVVGAKYDGISEFIDPRSKDLPQSLSSSVVFLDVFFAQSFPLSNDSPRYEYHSDKGIHISKGTDCSIILTFPVTDVAAYPASDPVIAFLNVDGLSGGSDAPFKNIR